MIVDFARKLDLLMKALTISRGRLAQDSGLDKSLIGRWVAGSVHPSALNLERVTAALARRRAGFTMLDWDRPFDDFASHFGGIAAPSALPGMGLIFPYDVTIPARAETAKRGARYTGFYWIYRRSFGRPGKIGRGTVRIATKDGLLEVREGVPGFEYLGWGLLMLNRLYCMLTEPGFEGMSFMITNAGRQPKAHVLHATYMGVSSDGLMLPKAAPCALVRVADLAGEVEADEATYQAMKAESGYVAPEEVPAHVLAFLDRDFGPRAFAEGGADMVTAPPSDMDDPE
jgi:transcriptional regulator with XRE-family HTH domain